MSKLQLRPANDNRKPSESVFEDLVRALVHVVEDSIAPSSTFEEREAAALAATNEAVRRMLESDLQRLSDDLENEIMIGGLLYRRHQPGRGLYYSLCGELCVARWTYRLMGQRNGPTKIAVELAAGLVEGATPAFAYALAHGYGKSPIRWVESDLRVAHRRPPSRSTLDRMAKALGTEAKKHAERIETVLRRSETIPEMTAAINLGLDRTTVPMEEPPDPGESRRKCSVRYRMAYVGTVCFTDASAQPLCTRRYAVPAHQGPAGVIRRMLADLKHALRSKPRLEVGVVQDNAPELWNLMRGALGADPVLRKHGWRETVDWYHLMEYLGRVLAVVVPSERRRASILQDWRSRLERSDRAIHSIRRELDRHGWKLPRFGKKFREFVRVAGIYLVYAPHFRYASLRCHGLHRGSGVTEGACKSLITMRAKRSGQRWRRPGIAAVLALKSLLDSERLPAFWKIFARRYEATCVAA